MIAKAFSTAPKSMSDSTDETSKTSRPNALGTKTGAPFWKTHLLAHIRNCLPTLGRAGRKFATIGPKMAAILLKLQKGAALFLNTAGTLCDGRPKEQVTEVRREELFRFGAVRISEVCVSDAEKASGFLIRLIICLLADSETFANDRTVTNAIARSITSGSCFADEIGAGLSSARRFPQRIQTEPAEREDESALSPDQYKLSSVRPTRRGA